jgi:signal transduction histidine kinase
MLAESESTSRAKSNFINLAAHELGTPISVIRGYIDMLADETLGPVTAEQKGPVDAVRATAGELAVRVDQLLTASRLEVGSGSRVGAGRADLTVAVHEALSRARDRARLIGATLAAEIPSGAVEVAVDARDLAVICDNLVNNAMTYSRAPAEVKVEVVPDGETSLLRVTDRGIGIPEHARERIFDQFYRVDDAEFGYPAGTGLGLYISRRLAERNGGSLFVERSAPGEGSTFTLRLPRAD